MQKYLFEIIALVAALVISLAATPVVKALAKKVGAIDVPKDNRRMHNHPIPRLGGLAIFLGFIISVLLFADLSRPIQGILLGSVVIVILGAIDDIYSLPAWFKFLVQIGAALIAVAFDVRIDILSNINVFSTSEYMILGALSVPVTVFWIVAITNSVNLIDGLDGLAVGVSTIASLTMLLIALIIPISDGNVAIMLAALAGACIGFMPYNLNPAKIFMGDTGALLLGYVLSTVSIIGLFKFYAIISFAVPLLILLLPLFDTAFAFCRRIFTGRNPMSPDRGHFHHRLIDMGFNQKQAVAILYAISTVLGLSAVVITTSGAERALIFILTICIVAVLGFFILKIRNNNNGSSKEPPENIEQKTGTEIAAPVEPDHYPEQPNQEPAAEAAEGTATAEEEHEP